MPAGHEHWPEMHDSPALQALPHEPQSEISLERSTQPALPQATWPGVVQTHWPEVHVSLAAQVVPHPPAALRIARDVYTANRRAAADYPTGHVQALLTQVEFGPQTLPHAPQLFESLVTFVHAFLQTMSPRGQAPHTPELQVAPAGQTLPPFSTQAPQLSGSLDTSEQPERHVTRPGPHEQTLFVQTAPGLQANAAPQPPQSALLLVSSTQTPLQTTWPAGQVHLPDTQAPPMQQVVPQAPQLFTSLERSAQTP